MGPVGLNYESVKATVAIHWLKQDADSALFQSKTGGVMFVDLKERDEYKVGCFRLFFGLG